MTGKTSVVSQITNYAHVLNPTQDFAVLNFQFEMGDRSIGARELTKPMEMSLNQLFSTDYGRPLTDRDLIKINDFHQQKSKDEIYYVTEPITSKEIRNEVIEFYKMVKKPIIVSIDHTVLVKKGADEKDQLEALYALSAELVFLKKKIPESMYLILSQLNRTIESPDRKVPGSIGNYPTSQDLFAADAMMQNADVVIIMNRPDVLGVPIYGPEKIKVTKGMMIFHLIKNRFGEQEMLFFEQDLKYFEIKDAPTPQEILNKKK